MKIICGLGNPGKKFEKTRHNLGFLVIDKFKKENKFPKFKLSKKFEAKISEKDFEGERVILVKPQTFMNASGRAIRLLIEHYNLPTINLLLIHDDLALPLGKIKVSFGKSSGGHKGVQSVIDELKTKDFSRIRIGILPKERPKEIKKFVLEKFKKEEQEVLKKEIEKAILAIKIWLKEGIRAAQSKIN